MGKLINMRALIIVGVSLVAVLSYFAYSKYTKRLDAELVGIVKNELNGLHLKDPGKIIYRQDRANHNCNYSELTVVYSSNKGEQEICRSLLSSLPLGKWQPQHMQQKTDFCESRPVGLSTALTARSEIDSASSITLRMEAYPKEALHVNTFMPVADQADVKKEAASHGKSFYYIEFAYRGPHDRAQCPCEEGGDVCEYANSTFYESTFSDLTGNAD